MLFDLENDIEEVLSTFPKLNYNGKELIGEIDIFDKEDNYCSSFNIKVLLANNYPYEFPILYESGNDIPHIIDRHIGHDGSCCVCVTQEEDIRKSRGITIKEFMSEYVVPFFANQTYFDLNNGTWANGEYQHGYNGFAQYYQELFHTQDINIILNGFKYFFSKSLKSYEKCFCGSGLKYKKCHLKTHIEMSKISLERLKEDYEYLNCRALYINYSLNRRYGEKL